jgi:uncharacterized iron-regulated protein
MLKNLQRLAVVLIAGLTPWLLSEAMPAAGVHIEHDGNPSTLEELAEHMQDARAVVIGEMHDRLDHHDNQLRILQALDARGIRLAIGLEAFEQPAQEHLDAFVAGRIDLRELLRRTRWYQRWRFDFRLYEPVLVFARERGIPLLALNVPNEIVGKISAGHTDQLSASERAFLPTQVDRSVPGYRERLKAAWEQHPGQISLENFIEAQLLWDEGMAEVAARFAAAHPDRSLAIIAGNGHVEYGQGIAGRLARRLKAPVLTVVQVDGSADTSAADFVLRSQPAQLPDPARLGVQIELDSAPVRISGFAPNSPAEQAGLRTGDTILAVAGISVNDYYELRAALHGRQAGEVVMVAVRRQAAGAGPAESVNVKLY